MPGTAPPAGQRPAHLLLAALLLGACSSAAAPEPAAPPEPLAFSLTEQSDRLPLPEAEYHGVALADIDGDGDPDVLFAAETGLTVLRNDGNLAFVDITPATGLALAPLPSAWSVVPADYDGDGDLDLFVGVLGGTDRLFDNDGTGRFVDVTDARGLTAEGWTQGAFFADLDRDGDLDLWVSGYRPLTDPKLPGPGLGERGSHNRVWENVGSGFVDATARWGLEGRPDGETFTAAAADLDADGSLEIVSVDDHRTDELYIPNPNGGWVHHEAAFAQDGTTGLMGMDLGDLDGDGGLDIYATNWDADQVLTVRDGALRNIAPQLLGTNYDPSVHSMGWGVAVADIDNDGDQDVVTAATSSDDGYEELAIKQGRLGVLLNHGPWVPSDQPGRGQLEDISGDRFPTFDRATAGYGLAAGDLDGDGDLDFVIAVDAARGYGKPLPPEPPIRHSRLLIGDTEGQSIRLELRQSGPNRFAIGARIDVEVGPLRTSRVILAGTSFSSSHELVAHFGLGRSPKADRIQIRWPDGTIQVLRDWPAGRHLVERYNGGGCCRHGRPCVTDATDC